MTALLSRCSSSLHRFSRNNQADLRDKAAALGRSPIALRGFNRNLPYGNGSGMMNPAACSEHEQFMFRRRSRHPVSRQNVNQFTFARAAQRYIRELRLPATACSARKGTTRGPLCERRRMTGMNRATTMTGGRGMAKSLRELRLASHAAPLLLSRSRIRPAARRWRTPRCPGQRAEAPATCSHPRRRCCRL